MAPVDIVGISGTPGHMSSTIGSIAPMISSVNGDGSEGVGSFTRVISMSVLPAISRSFASMSSGSWPGRMRQLTVASAVCGRALSAWPAASRVATQVVCSKAL